MYIFTNSVGRYVHTCTCHKPASKFCSRAWRNAKEFVTCLIQRENRKMKRRKSKNLYKSSLHTYTVERERNLGLILPTYCNTNPNCLFVKKQRKKQIKNLHQEQNLKYRKWRVTYVCQGAMLRCLKIVSILFKVFPSVKQNSRHPTLCHLWTTVWHSSKFHRIPIPLLYCPSSCSIHGTLYLFHKQKWSKCNHINRSNIGSQYKKPFLAIFICTQSFDFDLKR